MSGLALWQSIGRPAAWVAGMLASVAAPLTAAELSEATRAALARSYLEQAKAYEFGEGAPRDPVQAAQQYCEAARLGDTEALYSLGWMYANGRGVDAHVGHAAALLGAAAAKGHDAARRALERLGEATGEMPACMEKSRSVAQAGNAGEASLDPGARDKPAGAASPAPAPEADTELDTYVATLSANKQQIADLVRLLAPQYGIHPRLALAVAVSESNLDLVARSPRGALGVMQLIPETAARFKVRNTFDPGQNIRGGLAYLRWLLAYYRGDVLLAVAAYNAGEGAVDRFRGIPPFMETAFYVKKIYAFFKQPQHPFDASLVAPSPIVAAVATR